MRHDRLLIAALSMAAATAAHAQTVLDRGTVAVPTAEGGNHISWRLLLADGSKPRYILTRDGREIARTGTPSFVDREGTPTSRYAVAQIGKKPSPAITPWARGYLPIPLDRPADRTTPTGERYAYTASDASVGDLDGDGTLEILVKWDPTISKDNAFPGYSGETLVDAYTMAGNRLWRIDLGRNIRSGAHYTHFMVQDFDGDGRAELMMKTGDGTIDGTGRVLGDGDADWRESGGEVAQRDRTGAKTLPDGSRVAPMQGRIVSGPEYITVFEGTTGRALASVPYVPARDPSTIRPTAAAMTAAWGDGYGNRGERYLAGVAHLDGKHPSGIFARGYYARTAIAAWDWRGGKLTQRWLFDSAAPDLQAYGGQGNHQLATADVDGDGRDEIVYGAMAIDDDGKPLWTTGLGHGDAMHVSDLDPTRPGMEKFGVLEDVRGNGGIGAAMLDARTGQVLWSTPADKDTGRGLAADIDPRHAGAEAWASNSPQLFDARGKVIPGGKPRFANFAVWWDGDRLREMLSGTRITKWDWRSATETVLLDATGAASNNGTKATPALSGDLIGDWREEVLLRAEDSSELRLYTTPIPTTHAIPALLQDRQYANAIAWQNTAYNQPPHPSFFLGEQSPPAR